MRAWFTWTTFSFFLGSLVPAFVSSSIRLRRAIACSRKRRTGETICRSCQELIWIINPENFPKGEVEIASRRERVGRGSPVLPPLVQSCTHALGRPSRRYTRWLLLLLSPSPRSRSRSPTLAAVSLLAPSPARAQSRFDHQQQKKGQQRPIFIASPSQWSSPDGSPGDDDGDYAGSWRSAFVGSAAARRRYTRAASPQPRALYLPYGTLRWASVATVMFLFVWAVMPSGSGSKGALPGRLQVCLFPKEANDWIAPVYAQTEYELRCTLR